MIHKSEIPLFPHVERMANVKADGRPYFRQHLPGYIECVPGSFFFDTFDEVKDYILQSWAGTEIVLSHDEIRIPEILVMVIMPDNRYFVVGYMQNPPNIDGIREWSEKIKYQEPSTVGVGYISNLRAQLIEIKKAKSKKIDGVIANIVLAMINDRKNKFDSDFNNELNCLWAQLCIAQGETSNYSSIGLINTIEDYLKANGFEYPWGL